MSLVTKIYTHGVWPATDTDYRGLGGRLRRWRRQERLSLAENQRQQWESLRRLLRHAHDSSSFYRARFRAAGLHPAEVRHPDDLRQLPPLTREDLRGSLGEIASDRYPRAALLQAASGGTTDTPVPLLRDRAGVAEKRAVQESFHAWAGMRPGDKVAWLWGARQDLPEHPSWRWRVRERYAMRRISLPASLLNPSVLEDYRLRLNRFRPRVIVAYPTPLELFCEYLQDCGRDYWRPRSVVCTAEALLPRQRELMAKVLGCPIFELYGSREFAIIAGECELHRGLHLNPLTAFVEYEPLSGVPREAGEGGTEPLRELLVTDLLNYGMPLIRYRINDCAAAPSWNESCGCGRGYPLLRPIAGRRSDVFCLPNGDRVPGIALTRLVLGITPGLAKVQLIQETRANFRLRYVPRAGFATAELESLRLSLANFFPSGIRWTFEPVSEIPREASGKTRPCISLLAQPQRAEVGRAD